jgi:hypothetical protein
MDGLCDSIQKRLVKLHLSKKTIIDDPEVQAHLEVCAACRLYRDHLDRENRELEGYAESLDSYVNDVHEKLHHRIVSEPPSGSHRKTHLWWVILLLVPLAVAFCVVMNREPRSPSPRAGADTRSSRLKSPSSAIPNPVARIVEIELQLAQQHFKQRNLPALLELLDSENRETRLRVTQYLAQIGDRTALAPLERLARNWDAPADGNPYVQAMAQIEQRLADEQRLAASDTRSPEPDSAPVSVTREEIPAPPSTVRDTTEPGQSAPSVIDSTPATVAESPSLQRRTLVGRFALLGDSMGIPWSTLELTVVRLPQGPDVPRVTIPEDYPEMTLMQLQEWCDIQQGEIKPASWSLFPPNAQGYFHCSNLEPGRYAIVGEMTLDRVNDPLHQDARLWHEIVIPPLAPDAPAEQPVETGTIELLPDNLVPGDVAPDFSLPGLDTERVRLADYRGKLVLLSFYPSSELEGQTSVLQDLKSLMAQYRETDFFMPIGMLASERHSLLDRKQVELAGLTWRHALVGPDAQNRTHIEYDVLGVDQWPWHVLVGPDGTLVAIGLQGDELIETIEANLP